MKRLIFSALLLSAVTANAQVGINTDNPKATLHVVSKAPAARAEGIVFPHATQAEINSWAGMGGLEIGTTVYNTDQRCLESWTGVKWANHCGGRQVVPPGPPIPPTNPDQILPAPVPPPTLPSLPGGLVLGDSGYYIASIYDDNYLPYTANTGTAQFGVSNPDGHDTTSPSNPNPAENYIIDVQGILDHTGVEVAIPIKQYTVGGTVTIPAFSVFSKVAAGLTQNNTETEVELHFPAQSFTYGGATGQRRYIKATLRAKDPLKPLLVRKLDMNIGNGADYRGVPLAEFKYFSDDNKTAKKTFYFNAVTGIPDLNFSTPQGASSGMYSGQYLHRFIYVPAYGLDGKVWLSNNLGAAYANLDDFQNFNPNKRASSPTDHKAYGSMFQFGTVSNLAGLLGHELVTWASATSGQPKIPSLNWTLDWSSAMSPYTEYCPQGFITPTRADWQGYTNSLTNGIGYGGAEMWNDLSLRLPAVGYRNFNNGAVFGAGTVSTIGYYGSRSSSGPNTRYRMAFLSNHVDNNDMLNSYGITIRCIKQ